MEPRIYTYKITFSDQGWWYWGVHTEKKAGEEYDGSPSTHKDKWKWFKYEKQVLEYFDTCEEAYEVEKRLIKPDLHNPNCLNENLAGTPSFQARSKGGQTNVRTGHLQRISKLGGTNKGGKWYNNGQREVCLVDGCPEGFRPGRLSSSCQMPGYDRSKRRWYNNGKEHTLNSVCPKGWKPGMLP